MDPEGALAEIMGRATGVNHGKGGSMHLTDARLGLVGSFAIVGAGLPVAVGLGRSAQLKGDGRISATFFGDGATNIGAFHEAMNLASMWQAPVIFVCENNLYGEFSRIDHTTPVTDLAIRASSYAMRAEIVDGNDVQAVFGVARTAAELARSGQGPTFIECKTYRQRGHSRSDPAKYRDAEEVAEWIARDPIVITREQLRASDAISDDELLRAESEIVAEIERAADNAARAPWPSIDEVASHVYG